MADDKYYGPEGEPFLNGSRLLYVVTSSPPRSSLRPPASPARPPLSPPPRGQRADQPQRAGRTQAQDGGAAHIAWSGLRILDPDRPRQRRSLYRTVLAEGMRDDLCRFLNKGILLELWPVLRKLINTAIKDVREEAFPEELLAEAEYRMTDLPKAPADEWESVTIDITDAYGKRTYVQLRPDQL
ncbi:hypothetical protein [Streptomyces mirabilis]|uniref:hypothetical protein n=1 Tax=Streptomyces mirabilis TaxID=68239 RepID=UPI0036540C4D